MLQTVVCRISVLHTRVVRIVVLQSGLLKNVFVAISLANRRIRNRSMGSQGQGHTMFVRRMCLEIERCIFKGILFRFPRSRLSPPEYNRVELTTFIRQNQIVVNYDRSLEARAGT
jgi:hypothetical protein